MQIIIPFHELREQRVQKPTGESQEARLEGNKVNIVVTPHAVSLGQYGRTVVDAINVDYFKLDQLY